MEQIIGVLKQAQVGVPVAEVIRKAAISEQTFYRWKAKHAGLEVDQVRQMGQWQEENLRLKQWVAGRTLDKTMLQDVLPLHFASLMGTPCSQKMVKPSRRGRWSIVQWEAFRQANGMDVAFYVCPERPTAIEAVWIHGLSCGCASARSLRQECVMDTARSAYC